MKQQQVQIPKELFYKLISYHLGDNYSAQKDIEDGLMEKLDAMINRELYTKYKVAPTKEEQEKARIEYLDRKGIHKDFRW